jgi:hypothetical protein
MDNRCSEMDTNNYNIKLTLEDEQEEALYKGSVDQRLARIIKHAEQQVLVIKHYKLLS